MSDGNSEVTNRIDGIAQELGKTRGEFAAMKAENERRHDKYNEIKAMAVANREALIELHGRDGKSGRVGEMEKDMDGVQTDVKDMKATVVSIDKKLDRQSIKLGLIVAVAGTGGGLLASVAVKLLVGG